MIRIFAGYDPREAIGYHAFCASVIERSSVPVTIAPVRSVDHADGSNAFTYARYDVARLCGFKGWAIFVDGADMVCLDDIAELWALRDDRYAVQLVKHDYKTRHPVKYMGTSMQCPNRDYARKNWSSLMLINCAAPEWRRVWPDGVLAHQFNGFSDDRIGELPKRWNVLVDEGQECGDPAIIHWTAGIPAFPYYKNAPRAQDWFDAAKLVNQYAK